MTVPSRKKTLLSRKEENLIARLRPEAMRLALAVSIHGLELAEWRREAGPKSRWSAHVKLKEHVVYQAFADASAALGAFLQTHIPKHWDISDWACRPARMGGERSAGPPRVAAAGPGIPLRSIAIESSPRRDAGSG